MGAATRSDRSRHCLSTNTDSICKKQDNAGKLPYFNVHTPDTEDKSLPVEVYVHGGGFQIGYGDMLVPKALMVAHNIIAVTLNYRLGIHGFLSLGTEDVPGNGGMKDIVVALRWVKNNIANFGGDPDDVTAAGNSAGAAAVDLLMLSKSAEGLIKSFLKVVPA